jgi:hypothetical protein
VYSLQLFHSGELDPKLALIFTWCSGFFEWTGKHMKQQILKHVISTSFYEVSLWEVKVVFNTLSMRRILYLLLSTHTVNPGSNIRQTLQGDF